MHLEKIKINEIKVDTYNPRKISKEQLMQLEESVKRFGVVDPLIVNRYPGRKNVLVGGHQRLKVLIKLGHKEVSCVIVKVNPEREKELNLRLNRNLGEFDFDLLADFNEDLLKNVGFSSEELDNIFDLDLDEPENFDLQKELERLKITKIKTKKGDIYQLGSHRLMCGDSSKLEDILKLMDGKKADFCFTDPPYNIQAHKTGGFGYKHNRKYIETKEAPKYEDWIPFVAKIAKPDFNIVIFENWRNLVPLWLEMAKHWRIKNMIIWHLSNRNYGYSTKNFFNKYDIALFGKNGVDRLNLEDENELIEEYESALYGASGKYHYDRHLKGSKFFASDHITSSTSNTKASDQNVVYGIKPLEILIPYIKILSKRGDIVIDFFGGSGSTLMGCEKMKRICYLMELVPTYCEVIISRWKKLTGQEAVKING